MDDLPCVRTDRGHQWGKHLRGCGRTVKNGRDALAPCSWACAVRNLETKALVSELDDNDLPDYQIRTAQAPGGGVREAVREGEERREGRMVG